LENYWTIFSQFWFCSDPLFNVFERQIGKLLDDFFSILAFFGPLF